MTKETTVVDPKTGGAKGQKLARFDLIPAGPLWQLAELYGRGALKYADRNWERGYKWSLSFGAMMRHAWKLWGGETYDVCDAECPQGCVTHTGVHHGICVAFHAFALVEFTATYPDGDDRPNSTSPRNK